MKRITKKKSLKDMIVGDLTNAQRASFVAKYLDDFSRVCGDDGDKHTALIDFLADLRHWADANMVDYDEANRTAADHHYNEVVDERTRK